MIDLKKIEERCERANKGPWFTKSTPKDQDGWAQCWPICYVARGQGVFVEAESGIFPAANQELIAHAVTDLPALIDWAKRAAKYFRDDVSNGVHDGREELLTELEPA